MESATPPRLALVAASHGQNADRHEDVPIWKTGGGPKALLKYVDGRGMEQGRSKVFWTSEALGALIDVARARPEP